MKMEVNPGTNPGQEEMQIPMTLPFLSFCPGLSLPATQASGLPLWNWPSAEVLDHRAHGGVRAKGHTRVRPVRSDTAAYQGRRLGAVSALIFFLKFKSIQKLTGSFGGGKTKANGLRLFGQTPHCLP